MEATSDFKYAAALLVFFAGIGGATFARQLGSWKSGPIVSCLANTFAGGVFLGAALIHMMPDASQKLQIFFGEMNYPHFALIAGTAFLFVLLLDKVIALPHVGDASQGGDDSGRYPYVLALLLSIHSVITGVALGLEQNMVGAIAILVAVVAHKSIAAMALGISFDREKVDEHRSRTLLWTFFITTPSGIVLGTVLSNQLEGPTQNVVEGVFDAVAGGSFLYIAVVDILVEEFHQPHRVWLFVSAMCGFAIMAALGMWI